MTNEDKSPKCPKCGADGQKVGAHVPGCYQCSCCYYRYDETEARQVQEHEESTYFQCPNCPSHMEEHNEDGTPLGYLYCPNCDITAFQGMPVKDKMRDILMGLLMTRVEDNFVRPEHQDTSTHEVPGCTFAQQAMHHYEAEAENCHVYLDIEDKMAFLRELERVSQEVRT